MTPEEAFTGEKPEIGHLRIFGCPVYVHVPRERRTKLDPFGRKGVFVGYSEFAKAYWIYIPRQRKIELSRDVTFEEDIAYRRSRHAESDSDEQEAPQEVLASPSPAVERKSMEEDDLAPPIDSVDSFIPNLVPRDITEMGQKRKLAWVRQTLQDAEGHTIPRGATWESKRPQRFGCYVALMSSILDLEPSTYDEAAGQQCWKEAMMEEYESIMKNDVWEVVSRPDGKSVVTSCV